MEHLGIFINTAVKKLVIGVGIEGCDQVVVMIKRESIQIKLKLIKEYGSYYHWIDYCISGTQKIFWLQLLYELFFICRERQTLNSFNNNDRKYSYKIHKIILSISNMKKNICTLLVY